MGADGRVGPCCPSNGLGLSPALCRGPQAHAGVEHTSGGPTGKEYHEAPQFALVQLVSSLCNSSRVDGGVGVKSLSQEAVFRAVCPGGSHRRCIELRSAVKSQYV